MYSNYGFAFPGHNASVETAIHGLTEYQPTITPFPSALFQTTQLIPQPDKRNSGPKKTDAGCQSPPGFFSPYLLQGPPDWHTLSPSLSSPAQILGWALFLHYLPPAPLALI